MLFGADNEDYQYELTQLVDYAKEENIESLFSVQLNSVVYNDDGDNGVGVVVWTNRGACLYHNESIPSVTTDPVYYKICNIVDIDYNNGLTLAMDGGTPVISSDKDIGQLAYMVHQTNTHRYKER